MAIQLPAGDLARTIAHEAESEWPAIIEIVAYWRPDRRGRSERIEIPADQFFGRGNYGAPMSGDQLVGMVNRLRVRRK